MVNTCRICRCEGSPDQPLFHPCKCRGSIKYIHQDCLQFWLQHSNKDTCDICHSKFHFKVIFKDNVQPRLPLKYILAQFAKDLVRYQYIACKYILKFLALCVEIPLVVSAISKAIDWHIGVPVFNEGVINALLGESYSDFILQTIVPGAFISLAYAAIILALILIQNTFAQDHGFQKIINKRIGMDPKRFKIMKLLLEQQRTRLTRQKRHPFITSQVIQSYIDDDLKSFADINNIDFDDDEEYQHFLNVARDDYLQIDHSLAIAREYEDFKRHHPFPDHLDIDEIKQLHLIDRTMRYHIVEADLEKKGLLKQFDVTDDELLKDESIINTMNMFLNERNEPHRPAPPRVPEPFVAPANANPANADAAAAAAFAANAPEDMDVEEIGFWTGPLTIPAIIQITLLANLVSFGALITFKLIPSHVGMLLLLISHQLFVPTASKLLSYIPSEYIENILNLVPVKRLSDTVTTMINGSKVAQLTLAFCHRNIITPLSSAYMNTINNTPTSSVFERLFVQLCGYAGLAMIVYIAMRYLESTCSQLAPLAGSSRLAYIILIQIKSAVKVFTLIFIEWCIFPIFCGLQVEFALVPIFNNDLFNYHLDPPLLLVHFFGIVPTWFLGTFFMYFFASFVSMIRSKVLRPGVLFFIKPSDDPNVQLVHDALMRPFALRFSRILLSAAIYAAYIHIEFTLVAWLLRLLTPLLPFNNSSMFDRVGFVIVFIGGGVIEKPLVAYWKSVFSFACAKLRLSSFLLNKDENKERGRIIYRSLYARISSFPYGAVPNYNYPVSLAEVPEYFVNFPEESCCFVPDGNYVRAPDDDRVSRRFVRTLFVSVTRNDKLLEPIPKIPDDEEEKFNPYGDDEPLDATTYTVVYRPPHFRARLAGLFAALWAASMLFTGAIYLLSIIIGKSLIKLTRIESILRLQPEWYRLDVYSVIITLILATQAESAWRLVKHQLTSEQGEVAGKWFDLFKLIIHDLTSRVRRNYAQVANMFFVRIVLWYTYAHVMTMTFAGLCIQPLYHPEFAPMFSGISKFVTIAVLFIPMISIIHSDRYHRIYCYTWITIVTMRLVSLLAQHYFPTLSGQSDAVNTQLAEAVKNATNVQSIVKLVSEYDLKADPFITRRVVLSLFPAFSEQMASFFALDEFTGAEAWTYFTIWLTVSVYVLSTMLASSWSGFVEKTKEIYFDNMKVLSNAGDDDNGDDEDDEDEEEDDEDNGNNAGNANALRDNL